MTDLDQGQSPDDIDVDALLSGLDGEGSAPQQEAAPETPLPPQEYEYEWRGQRVKEPLDMILKRASMGRDYAQNTEALKRERSEWEQQRAEFENRFKPYREIDDFIKSGDEGKQWWDHVNKQWSEREKPQGIDPNLKPLFDELNGLKSFVSELQQEKLQQKIAKEDESFTQEIQSIQKQFADLDWQTPDQDGKSLEFKVLEHGTKNGIKSFKTAFLDFYHPELEKRWESRGREAVAKDTQKRTRLGLLGETSAPKKGISSAENVKNRSYDDLAKEALEELGIN